MALVNLEFVAKDAVKAIERGDVIIVVDVLRCTSTVITALANGAKGIIPVKTVREALAIHGENPESILAGERNGVRPIGFQLGNSPLEFCSRMVRGKKIIMTTTSGTKALTKSKEGKWVLVGAFLNVEAVADAALRIAEGENRGMSIVLSGKRDRFSLEDYLCAGAIVERLSPKKIENSDASLASLLAFQQASDSLSNVISMGSHAQYLESIGLEVDVHFCCRQNRYSIVPYLEGEMIVPLNMN